jgi:hypothetical protein
MQHNLRAAGLAAGLTIALAAAGLAASPPSAGRLDFDVVRNGKDIGDHSFAFSGSPAQLEVQVRTDVHVQVPLIRANLYSFTHQSTESWRGGHLAGLTAETDDDGTPHRISIGAGETLPASLWADDTVSATTLINTIDGRAMRVRVTDMGSETVPAGCGSVNARHFRISGDLERDVWYDADGLLARLTMTAEDGSLVTYVRK